MKNEYLDIGKLIKIARMNRQLSQLELSKKMNLSPASINQFEKGVSKPQLVDAFRLEKLLGLEGGPISRLVIAEEYRQATGHTLPTHGGGIEEVEARSVHSEEDEEKIEGMNKVKRWERVMGEVIRVPVKLPKDIYLKFEFE